jgi:MoxR-like ATPase
MKKTKIGGVSLDVVGSLDHRVPKSAPEIKLPGKDLGALALGISENLPCLLIGETGTGKTGIVRWLAMKTQKPYVRVNMSGYTTPDELIGSKSIKDGETYFENGVITDAMQVGAVLVLDEINATSPDCLFILHGLLDDDQQITLPNGEVIRPSDGFRVFATMNPDYAGTKGLNQALLDRFPIIVEVDTLPKAREQSLLVTRTGVEETIAGQLVEVASRLRKDYRENKLTLYVSTRSLLNVCRLVRQGWEVANAWATVVINRAQVKEERLVIGDVFKTVINSPSGTDFTYHEVSETEYKQITDIKLKLEELQVKAEQAIQANRDLDNAKNRQIEINQELEKDKRELQERITKLEEENNSLAYIKKAIGSLSI